MMASSEYEPESIRALTNAVGMLASVVQSFDSQAATGATNNSTESGIIQEGSE